MMFAMDPTDEHLRRRAKTIMRQRFKGHRAAIPRSAAGVRSAAIRERLLELAAVRDAEHVAVFWPMEKHREVDLRPLDAALRARGARVAYPRCDVDRRHMAFHFVDELEAMVAAPMGYREPAPDMPLADRLDVVVVPGLAFDPRGHRIGYGAGFYDGALPRVCPPALSIGVAFDFQLAVEIPNTPGDVTVHQVVTDRRTLATGL
jgi:5-formyltetrahydrofolate cyclo-ligase